MPKAMHQAGPPLRYYGAVDADGHILKPPDLWERYLEPKYRSRLLRFIVDEKGLEDFPHADHTPEYLRDLEELVAMFPDDRARRRFLGDNSRELFQIDA